MLGNLRKLGHVRKINERLGNVVKLFGFGDARWHLALESVSFDFNDAKFVPPKLQKIRFALRSKGL